MEMMKKYETPMVNVIDLDAERALLAGSPTGEAYDDQVSFDGEWS